MTIIWAVVLLGVLIFVHELGHFLVCKAVGVGVERFSLGFGPKLAGFSWGGTEYIISAFPLGGYVKMIGEDPDQEIAEEDRVRAYNNQSVPKRMGIVVAGPLFNLIFAGLVFSALSYTGLPALTAEVGRILEDSPAEKAGIRKNDLIVGVDGRDVRLWNDVRTYIHDRPGTAIELTLERDGSIRSVTVVPERKTQTNIFGESIEVGLIGIAPSGRTVIIEDSAGPALVNGFSRMFSWCRLTVVSIYKIVDGTVSTDNVGGPIMIVQMAGQRAAKGAMDFFFFMGVISVNLGILNLFPIPILDGGHLVFLAIESIIRRPLSPSVLATAQKAGLFVILLLMTLVFYNDLSRIFSGGAGP